MADITTTRPRRPPEAAILWPFVLSRLLLMLAGLTVLSIPGPTGDLAYNTIFSNNRLIDIWARWDAGWYVDIIEEGYTPAAEGFSSTAFFPLYPYAVEYVHRWLGPAEPGLDSVLVAGLALSNAFFLAALVLIYRLVVLKTGDHAAAYRVALYLCVAPFSLIFSSFYTESLFLLLTVGAFYAAERRSWAWAAVAAGLAGLTRATGVALALPLLIIWWGQWRRGEVTWRPALAALMPAVGLGIFMAILYDQVGDPLSFLKVGDAWGHQLAWPWRAFTADITQEGLHGLNVFFSLLFIGLSVAAFRYGPAYGLWALVAVVSPLALKGNLISILRYLMVAFPAFMVLGEAGRRWPRGHDIILITFTVVLTLMMVLWTAGFYVA